MLINETLKTRFSSYVAKSDHCWEWTGKKNNKGYGMIRTTGNKSDSFRLAHRISWFLANGDIPEGFHVLHRCDNPGCVNPDHLFLGTHLENMRDKLSKGRAFPDGWLENVRAASEKRKHPDGTWEERRKAFSKSFVGPIQKNSGHFSDETAGTGNNKAKLSEQQVLEMRRLHAEAGTCYSDLAKQFGVTKGMVGHIVRRVCWSHI
jgi:hypothetical protein